MAVQPIIRGIQAVGSVEVFYKYNGGTLTGDSSVFGLNGGSFTVDTSNGDGVNCAGFRLDGDFLDANPQIASSFMVPILGGGAIALTNNNRSGVLNIRTTRVSSPSNEPTSSKEMIEPILDGEGNQLYDKDGNEATRTYTIYGPASGAMATVNGLGPVNTKEDFYDLTLLLQAQQSHTGGDDVGSTITIKFKFAGQATVVQFQGCTVANIKPLALSGNDAVDYAAQINYLNWTVNYSSDNNTAL